MKLSSSSSSSPTPTSTLSSTSSLTFDSKSAVSGCFAGILHRILCSRSLPTHPSDQITESCNSEELEETKQKKKRSVEDKDVVPSIVARLMGLESMPTMSPGMGARTRPDLITRSRSMNSLDCAKGSSDQTRGGGHRRVKSSTLSFLETPTFIELENEEFLVLSFENGSHEEVNRKSSSSRRKKSDTTTGPGFENKKQESETETVKFRRRRRKKKKVRSVETDCSSEDSSPVSVLDFNQFMTDHEVPTSELDSNLVESDSRRKLSPEPGDQVEYRIRINDSHLMITGDDDRKAKKSTDGIRCVGIGSRKKSCSLQSQSFLEMLDQICKMTEAEIAGSKWLCRDNNSNNSNNSMILKKHDEDLEQICADFESQIVDQSLDELVHQLVGLPMEF